MLLAYHPEAVDPLRAPTAADPWRVLVSGSLAAWPCVGMLADARA